VLAAFCAAGSLLSHVTSHYDRKGRDRFYGLTAHVSSLLGWTIFWAFVLALLCQQFRAV
jgi:hypothetical protein